MVDLKPLKAERLALIAVLREEDGKEKEMNINRHQHAPGKVLCLLYTFPHFLYIHVFNKYLSSAYPGPDPVPGTRNAAVSKADKKFSAIIEFTFYLEVE